MRYRSERRMKSTSTKKTKGYDHGFTPDEQERLYRQARFVEHRVHVRDQLGRCRHRRGLE